MGELRWAGLRVDAVDQLASAGAAARVTLVVTGDPAQHAGRTQGSSRRGADLVAVPSRMVVLTAQGRVVRARLPVLVLAIETASLDATGLDRWRRLLPGQRLEASVVLRPARAGEPLAAVALARSPPALVGRPPLVQRVAGTLRAGLRRAVVGLPAGPRGLLPGLVVGDTSRMPPDLVDDFRTSGLTHLVAVSGANVEQEKECRGVASAAGWEVVEVFTDNDRSASRYATKGRPAFRALHRRYRGRPQCDVLVTWEASRFQRDLEAYVKLRELCRRHGVQWSYSGRTFDLARTDDRLATGLDALLAERESDMTRDRVLRAVRSNAEHGRPHGKLLYGYRRDYDAKTGALVAQVADDAQAAVVREAARRVVAGETPYAVAQDFTRRGIPTPRGGQKWDLIQVKRLCVNPGYVGKRVHQGRVVGDADWAPLLEESVHYQLVARLGDPRRRSQRSSAVQHLLSGIALCGVCQSRVRLQKNRGRLSYMCGAGFHVSRGESDVDMCVEAVTVERLRRPDILELMSAGATDELDEAMAELAGLRARLDGFYDVAARGELTPAALARVEATLLPQIATAEARARRVVLSPVLADVTGPDAARGWAGLSTPQKREVVNAAHDGVHPADAQGRAASIPSPCASSGRRRKFLPGVGRASCGPDGGRPANRWA